MNESEESIFAKPTPHNYSIVFNKWYKKYGAIAEKCKHFLDMFVERGIINYTTDFDCFHSEWIDDDPNTLKEHIDEIIAAEGTYIDEMNCPERVNITLGDFKSIDASKTFFELIAEEGSFIKDNQEDYESFINGNDNLPIMLDEHTYKVLRRMW